MSVYPDQDNANRFSSAFEAYQSVSTSNTFPAPFPSHWPPWSFSMTGPPPWISAYNKHTTSTSVKTTSSTPVTVFTSFVTKSAEISAATANSAAPTQNGSRPTTATVALAVGIPTGVIFIALLITLAFIFGRRTSQLGKECPIRVQWKSRKHNQISKEQELPADGETHELPTRCYAQEMPEGRQTAELAQRSPVELE